MEFKAHPFSGYLVNEDGSVIINPKTGYKLNPTLSPAGYLKIGTYICSGGTVHQLVYESFKGMVPKGLQINHKNGNKTDNRLDNLEVVTQRENTKHAYETGLAKGCPGKDNSMAKITEQGIFLAYKLFREGRCNKCVSDLLGVHDRYVSLVRHGKRWKHTYEEVFPQSNKWKCVCSSATTIENTSEDGSE